MTRQIALYLNVAEYLEKGYKRWREAVDGGDYRAMMPRWAEAHEGNLESAEFWRTKARMIEELSCVK